MTPSSRIIATTNNNVNTEIKKEGAPFSVHQNHKKQEKATTIIASRSCETEVTKRGRGREQKLSAKRKHCLSEK